MVIFTVLVLLFNFALGRLIRSESIVAFLISLPFPFLVLHMTYCVYGKRLHDMGRSDIDPAEIERIVSTYQAQLSKGNATVHNVMAGIIAAFTLWCGLSKPEPTDNKYGPEIA